MSFLKAIGYNILAFERHAMKSKSLLFTGIILLVIGILLRKMTQMDVTGLAAIITGVTCKLIYIVSKARSGEYKPGTELYILAFGLLLFFTGLYLRGIEQNLIKPIYLIVLGITLKIIFIIKFILIIRSNKK
jgi:threonine/homoserine efflux transporter RhtA